MILIRCRAFWIIAAKSLRLLSLIEAGAARHNLSVNELLIILGPHRRGVQWQQFVGLAVPVGDEDRIQLTHDRAGQADHQLVPVQAFLDRFLLVVVVDDQFCEPVNPMTPSTTTSLR